MAAGTVIPKRAARSCIGNSCTHHRDLSQKWRNSPDLEIQNLEHLSLAKFTLGIGIRCRQLDGSAPALGIGLIQLNELSSTPLADQDKALVLDDPQQPRGELGVSVELIDVLECLPACNLSYFFPVAVVAEDGCGPVYASTTMTENQLVKRFAITLFGLINQLLIH